MTLTFGPAMRTRIAQHVVSDELLRTRAADLALVPPSPEGQVFESWDAQRRINLLAPIVGLTDGLSGLTAELMLRTMILSEVVDSSDGEPKVPASILPLAITAAVRAVLAQLLDVGVLSVTGSVVPDTPPDE